jgi:hypothetical protein
MCVLTLGKLQLCDYVSLTVCKRVLVVIMKNRGDPNTRVYIEGKHNVFDRIELEETIQCVM